VRSAASPPWISSRSSGGLGRALDLHSPFVYNAARKAFAYSLCFGYALYLSYEDRSGSTSYMSLLEADAGVCFDPIDGEPPTEASEADCKALCMSLDVCYTVLHMASGTFFLGGRPLGHRM